MDVAGAAREDAPLALMAGRAWIALGALLLLCGTAVVWSLIGAVPVTVRGSALLSHPGSIVAIESATAGPVTSVHARPGDTVASGDLLARVDQPALREERNQARIVLDELRSADANHAKLEDEQLDGETRWRDSQTALLLSSSTEMERLADDSAARSADWAARQRERFGRIEEMTNRLVASLDARLDELRRLADRGLATREQIVAAESAAIDADRSRSAYESQASDTAIQEQESRQFVFDRRNRAAELRLESSQVELRWKKLQQEIVLARNERSRQIELRRERVASLDRRLAESSEIRAAHSGRVLEWHVEVGRTVGPGMALGSLARDRGPAAESERLRALAYFPLSDGKRIAPGMDVLVTPSTEKRERYGGIRGTVWKVAEFPTTRAAASAALGSDDVVQGLAAPGGMLEVEIALRTASTQSGYDWTTSGPPAPPTAGTMASARVVVERRTPLSFLVPHVRAWLLGPDPDAARDENARSSGTSY